MSDKAAEATISVVNDGYQELVTEEVEETIPADENGENGGVQMVKKPVLTASGGRQYTLKRHSVEYVEALMVDIKAKRDEYIARLTKLPVTGSQSLTGIITREALNDAKN